MLLLPILGGPSEHTGAGIRQLHAEPIMYIPFWGNSAEKLDRQSPASCSKFWINLVVTGPVVLLPILSCSFNDKPAPGPVPCISRFSLAPREYGERL